MQQKKVIEQVFGTPGRIAILRRLAKAPQPLSGRQVAELTKMTHRGAIQALATLVDAGIVRQRQVGRAYQYVLARENIVVRKLILPTFESEEALSDFAKDELVQIFAASSLSLILFGSFARGEATPGSDIDVLAITQNEKKKTVVEKLAETHAVDWQQKFASLLALHALTLDELRSKSGAPFLDRVRKEGVLLSGQLLADLERKYA